LRLPMTKSVVRAMDTVTAFCRSAAGGGIDVDRFVIGGASKRGWTAWTAAAVDQRVVAVAPVVIDLLNVEKSFEHHYRAYGFWADGSVQVKAETHPIAAALWQAANPVARDFRLEAIGPAYRRSALEERGDGVYIAKSPKPREDGSPISSS